MNKNKKLREIEKLLNDPEIDLAIASDLDVAKQAIKIAMRLSVKAWPTLHAVGLMQDEGQMRKLFEAILGKK